MTAVAEPGLARRFLTEDGQPVCLGEILGRGGEGTVYALANRLELVAKVYHEPPTADQQAKLRAMAQGCDDELQRIAAWPVATLHEAGPGSPVCGFLMPRLRDCQPIHHLYNPGQRKQRFPDADFAFLVHTARNIAAAFATLHRHGHVVADVNQGNLFVAADSTVRLIDCDSFQIHTPDSCYSCEVGVFHFTAPELQGLPFRGLVRTVNHDLFGLAALLFHVLMMGRHPYAGVYRGEGDMPLERAIGEYRYAYGAHAAAANTGPPPNSLTPEQLLPEDIRQLFEQAFTVQGASLRPNAEAWVEALERLRAGLKPCRMQRRHRYWQALSACPWCRFAARTQVQLFRPAGFAMRPGATAPPDEHFPVDRELMRLQEQIRAIEAPGPIEQPRSPENPAANLPKAVRKSWLRSFPKVPGDLGGGEALAVIWMALALAYWLLLGVVRLCIFIRETYSEQHYRQQQQLYDEVSLRLDEARKHYLQSQLHWTAQTDEALFLNLRERVLRDIVQWQQRLPLSAERRLALYLARLALVDEEIDGLSTADKLELQAQGIVSAADVTPEQLAQLTGEGAMRVTMALMRWRKTMKETVPMPDVNELLPASEYRAIRDRVVAELKHLRQLRTRILVAREQLAPGLVAAEAAMRQAQVNMDFMNQQRSRSEA